MFWIKKYICIITGMLNYPFIDQKRLYIVPVTVAFNVMNVNRQKIHYEMLLLSLENWTHVYNFTQIILSLTEKYKFWSLKSVF